MKQIILASQSPRRKELLTAMGVDFTAITSNFEENLDDSRTSEEVAIELALGKVHDVAKEYPDAIVIGSDTIVEVDGIQLEKPVDEADAKRLLTLLSGKSNYVISSIAVVCLSDNIEQTSFGKAEVHFKPYNEQAIDTYIATGDTADKAGAYGIQSGAAPLIDYVNGDYDTILGLPTKELAKILATIGIQAQPVFLEPPVPQRSVV